MYAQSFVISSRQIGHLTALRGLSRLVAPRAPFASCARLVHDFRGKVTPPNVSTRPFVAASEALFRRAPSPLENITKNGQKLELVRKNFQQSSVYCYYVKDLGLSHTAHHDGDQSGTLLWQASDVLCEYIESASALFDNRTVVELGSGSGLCGLVASRWASRVLMTDASEESLGLVQDNIDVNEKFNAGLIRASVGIQRLKWGSMLKPSLKSCADVVIGSEIVYPDTDISSLWKTVDEVLATRTPDPSLHPVDQFIDAPKFILLYVNRFRPTTHHLFAKAEAYGFRGDEIEVAPFAAGSGVDGEGSVQLLVFTRNSSYSS